MTDEQRKAIADLIAALDKIPPDVLDEFGEYPPHDAAADALGVKISGTRASGLGEVRLGALTNARGALKAMVQRLEALERVGSAVRHYRDCLEINERGAYKHGIGALEEAERDLDAALARLGDQ